MKRIVLVVLSTAVLVLAGGAGADEAGLVVIESAELRAQPAESAAMRGRVHKGDRARRLDRSGGWVRVDVADDDRTGWLRLWQVRAAESGDGNPLLQGLQRLSRSIAGLFRGRDDSDVQQTGVTATIGVRGLDAGDFEQAAPAPDALQRMRQLRGDREQAAAFARDAGLQRREVVTLESRPSQDWGEW